MLQLDHFALFSHNLYRATFNVSQETGLGNYDGGFFPNYGIGIKVVPLGPDLFLEIESLIEYSAIKRLVESDEITLYTKALAHPEVFYGWCFRTDTREELDELARVAGFTVDEVALNEEKCQQMMTGEKVVVVAAPRARDAWPLGMPNVYFWPDMSKHDGRFPATAGTGTVTPAGVAWIEVGGSAEDFEAWFGGYTKASDHPIRFNGKSLGLYAIAVKTEAGEVVIRRPSLNE